MPEVIRKGTVLVVDDDYKALKPVYNAINKDLYDAIYSSEEEIFRYLENTHVRIVIIDLKTTRTGAIGLLNKIKTTQPDVAFLITSPTGVTLYKDGHFYEYLGQSLLYSINEILNLLLAPKTQISRSESSSFGELIGFSKAMEEVYSKIELVAKTNITVLVEGETGTGKELVARTIHSLSQRSQGPFVAINCGAIPSTLIESELFGHEKGAFSSAYYTKKGLFEMAYGGTIFLDEIAELDKSSQVKLLRVLQERTAQRVGSTKYYETNARVIAATSKDLQNEVSQGNFREDLYYRINVFPIYLPPLRDRKDDIPLLVEHFLRKYSNEVSRKEISITKEAMDLLCQKEYPGNVRELENLVLRILVSCKNGVISAQDIANCMKSSDFRRPLEIKSDVKDRHMRSLEEIEKYAILDALTKTEGNKKAAAEMLGITRRLLYLRLKKYEIKTKSSNLV